MVILLRKKIVFLHISKLKNKVEKCISFLRDFSNSGKKILKFKGKYYVLIFILFFRLKNMEKLFSTLLFSMF